MVQSTWHWSMHFSTWLFGTFRGSLSCLGLAPSASLMAPAFMEIPYKPVWYTLIRELGHTQREMRPISCLYATYQPAARSCFIVLVSWLLLLRFWNTTAVHFSGIARTTSPHGKKFISSPLLQAMHYPWTLCASSVMSDSSQGSQDVYTGRTSSGSLRELGKLSHEKDGDAWFTWTMVPNHMAHITWDMVPNPFATEAQPVDGSMAILWPVALSKRRLLLWLTLLHHPWNPCPFCRPWRHVRNHGPVPNTQSVLELEPESKHSKGKFHCCPKT